ncbi:hypothetical protein HYW76_04025 [Candidatus Pacearchaeota archaeon]|nr:hypothetical protein [Candidatus Pacearchaeota archaeon]
MIKLIGALALQIRELINYNELSQINELNTKKQIADINRVYCISRISLKVDNIN